MDTDQENQMLKEQVTPETESDTQENDIVVNNSSDLKKKIPEVGKPLSTDLLNRLINDKKIAVLKETSVKTPLIDLSDQIQWQVNHLDTLNEAERKLLLEFLFLNSPKEPTSVSWLNGLLEPVYASTREDTPYGVGFDDQVKFFTIDAETRNLYSGMLKEIVFEAMAMYEQILDMDYVTNVTIILEPMNPSVDSFSYKLEGPLGDEYMDEYRIHLNLNLSTDMMLASFTKELFRGFLYDYGYRSIMNKNHQFARHAGALWAVTLFEDYDFYDYYDIYTEDLYHQNSLNIASLNQMEMKSFYQLFYFLYQEQGELERVQNRFSRLLEDLQLSEAIKKPGEKSIHNLFANLTHKLFLMEDSSEIDFNEGSPLAKHTFSEAVLNQTIPEGLHNARDNEEWSTMALAEEGFRVFYFDVPPDETGKVTLLSNLQMDPTLQHSGMVVYKLVEDTWELGTVDTPYAMDFASGKIEEVVVIFFQYGPGIQHKYLWDYTDQINGDGALTLTYNKSSEVEGISTSTRVVLSITEDIELVVADELQDMADYNRLIAGNVYQVNGLQMNITGTIKNLYKDLDYEEVTTLSGSYHYDYETDQESFDNPLIKMPDFRNPTGMLDDASIDALEAATEALPDLVGEDADIDIPSIPNLDEEKDQLLTIELPKIQRLMRIKWMPSNGMFHFYNVFPPSVFGTTWVQTTTKYISTNAEGEIEIKTWKGEQYLDSSYFDVWLYNPSYDPTVQTSAFQDMPTTPEAFMEKYNDMDSITKQISAINGKFNMYNLYPGMNKGLQTLQLSDFKKRFEGTQDQQISFDDEQLKGKMYSRFKDKAGINYNISIDFQYDF